MELYIRTVGEDIIKSKFGIKAYLNIEEYKTFMTKDRQIEILKYKKYNLVSPQIYNMCYLFLTKKLNIDKQKVINTMISEVNENKKEMQKIEINKYTPKEYKESKKIGFDKSINWDIQEYEIVRGDWNSTLV